MSRRRGGWEWRALRCVKCGQYAVTTDEQTGDPLCIVCYQHRIEMREALEALQKKQNEQPKEEKHE